MRAFQSLVVVCALLALVGCADKLKVYDQGSMMLQEHHIPPTWDKPARTDYVYCLPSQLVPSKKWDMLVCPPDVSKDAYLSVRAEAVSGASYVNLVIPGVSNSAPLAAGVGAGLALSGSEVTQNAAASQSVQPGPYRGQYRHR